MDYAQLIPFWCLLGFLTGWIAQRRGRVGRTWFALGLLLGPVSLAVLFAARPLSSGSPSATDPV